MAQYQRTSPGNNSNKIVRIIGREIVETHTVYIIEIRIGQYRWSVRHRYNDFYELHQKLTSEIKSLDKNLLPKKKLFGNQSEQFIQKRQIELEIYLQSLLSQLPTLPSALVVFLEFTRYEVRGITQSLSEYLFLKGDEILRSRDAFTVSPLQLHAVCVKLKLAEPPCDSGRADRDLSHSLDFFNNITNVKIDGSSISIGNSNINMNELRFDLHVFKSLTKLCFFSHICKFTNILKDVIQINDVKMEHRLQVVLKQTCSCLLVILNYVKINGCNVGMITNVDTVKKTVTQLHVHNCLINIKDLVLIGLDCIDCSTTLDAEVIRENSWRTVHCLDLSVNQISSIDESIKLMTHVEHLNLSYNQIKSIENLQTLSSLTSVMLANNLISSITSLHARLGNVTVLNLKSNQLDTLSGLMKMYSLVTLDVSYNKIKEIEGVQHIGGLPCLVNLYLKCNPLENKVDYRVSVLQCFTVRANEIILDDRVATSGELDAVSVRLALRISEEMRDNQARSYTRTNSRESTHMYSMSVPRSGFVFSTENTAMLSRSLRASTLEDSRLSSLSHESLSTPERTVSTGGMSPDVIRHIHDSSNLDSIFPYTDPSLSRDRVTADRHAEQKSCDNVEIPKNENTVAKGVDSATYELDTTCNSADELSSPAEDISDEASQQVSQYMPSAVNLISQEGSVLNNTELDISDNLCSISDPSLIRDSRTRVGSDSDTCTSDISKPHIQDSVIVADMTSESRAADLLPANKEAINDVNGLSVFNEMTQSHTSAANSGENLHDELHSYKSISQVEQTTSDPAESLSEQREPGEHSSNNHASGCGEERRIKLGHQGDAALQWQSRTLRISRVGSSRRTSAGVPATPLSPNLSSAEVYDLLLSTYSIPGPVDVRRLPFILPETLPSVNDTRLLSRFDSMFARTGASHLSLSEGDAPIHVLWCNVMAYTNAGEEFAACVYVTTRYVQISRVIQLTGDNTVPKLVHYFYILLPNIQRVAIGYSNVYVQLEEAGPSCTFTLLTLNENKTNLLIDAIKLAYRRSTADLDDYEDPNILSAGSQVESILRKTLNQFECCPDPSQIDINLYMLVQCDSKFGIHTRALVISSSYIYIICQDFTNLPAPSFVYNTSTSDDLFAVASVFPIKGRITNISLYDDSSLLHDSLTMSLASTQQRHRQKTSSFIGFGVKIQFHLGEDGEQTLDFRVPSSNLRDKFLTAFTDVRSRAMTSDNKHKTSSKKRVNKLDKCASDKTENVVSPDISRDIIESDDQQMNEVLRNEQSGETSVFVSEFSHTPDSIATDFTTIDSLPIVTSDSQKQSLNVNENSVHTSSDTSRNLLTYASETDTSLSATAAANLSVYDNTSQSALADDTNISAADNISQSALADDLNLSGADSISQSALTDDVNISAADNVSLSALADDTSISAADNVIQSALVDDAILSAVDNVSQSVVADDANLSAAYNFSQSALADDTSISATDNMGQSPLADDLYTSAADNISQSALVDNAILSAADNISQSAVADDTNISAGDNISQSVVADDDDSIICSTAAEDDVDGSRNQHGTLLESTRNYMDEEVGLDQTESVLQCNDAKVRLEITGTDDNDMIQVCNDQFYAGTDTNQNLTDAEIEITRDALSVIDIGFSKNLDFTSGVYPSPKLVRFLDACRLMQVLVHNDESTAMTVLHSLTSLDIINYFHFAIAPSNIDNEELRYILWTGIIFYEKPMKEIPAFVMLSNRALYFLTEKTEDEKLSEGKIHSSQSEGVNNKEQSENIIHQFLQNSAVLSTVILLSDLKLVNIGCGDQYLRVVTSSKKVIAFIVRDRQLADQFIDTLVEILQTKFIGSPDNDKQVDNEDFYKMYNSYSPVDSEVTFARSWIQIVKPSQESIYDLLYVIYLHASTNLNSHESRTKNVEENLSLVKSKPPKIVDDYKKDGLELYLICFVNVTSHKVEKGSGTELLSSVRDLRPHDILEEGCSYSLVLTSRYIGLVVEDLVSYPIPDFARAPPAHPCSSVVSVCRVNELTGAVISGSEPHVLVLVFSSLSEDLTLNLDHFSQDSRLKECPQSDVTAPPREPWVSEWRLWVRNPLHITELIKAIEQIWCKLPGKQNRFNIRTI